MKLTLIKEAVQVDETITEEPANIEEITDVVETNPVEDVAVADSEINDAIAPEMTDVPTEQVPAEIGPELEDNKQRDFILYEINEQINDSWKARDKFLMLADSLNSLPDEVNKPAVKKLIEEISDDITVSIGMLYKVIQLIKPEISMLLDRGQNKASEVLLNVEEN